MNTLPPAERPRGRLLLLRIVTVAAVMCGMVFFHEPVDSACRPIARTVRQGVLLAGDSVGRCWEAVVDACDVAAASIRLLGRIGRESSPTPAAHANMPPGTGFAKEEARSGHSVRTA